MLNPVMFVDNEDDLIFADLRRFDETGFLDEVSASTSVYRDREFELHIANVNRKPLEHPLGVDLLYWDRVGDTYTLLQYKRLVRTEKRNSSDETEDRWHYTRKNELIEQLGKMNSFGTMFPSTRRTGASSRIRSGSSSSGRMRSTLQIHAYFAGCTCRRTICG